MRPIRINAPSHSFYAMITDADDGGFLVEYWSARRMRVPSKLIGQEHRNGEPLHIVLNHIEARVQFIDSRLSAGVSASAAAWSARC